MLGSTAHWMPLVNGYMRTFPATSSRKPIRWEAFLPDAAFRLLERDRVRYAVFHLHLLTPEQRADVTKRLQTYERYLQRRYGDDRVWIFRNRRVSRLM